MHRKAHCKSFCVSNFFFPIYIDVSDDFIIGQPCYKIEWNTRLARELESNVSYVHHFLVLSLSFRSWTIFFLSLSLSLSLSSSAAVSSSSFLSFTFTLLLLRLYVYSFSFHFTKKECFSNRSVVERDSFGTRIGEKFAFPKRISSFIVQGWSIVVHRNFTIRHLAELRS